MFESLIRINAILRDAGLPEGGRLVLRWHEPNQSYGKEEGCHNRECWVETEEGKHDAPTLVYQWEEEGDQ
tara:strand:- start:107 stop:316 length:210 start_codon:yes stop_codon:yes gene_type:complete